jgi:hypothetical protein
MCREVHATVNNVRAGRCSGNVKLCVRSGSRVQLECDGTLGEVQGKQENGVGNQ